MKLGKLKGDKLKKMKLLEEAAQNLETVVIL